jgi:hypothetical protein
VFAVLKDALEKLLDQPLGAIVVCLLYWISKLDGKLSKVQEKRVADAYRLATTANDCANALERNTDVLNALLKS